VKPSKKKGKTQKKVRKIITRCQKKSAVLLRTKGQNDERERKQKAKFKSNTKEN